MDLNEIKENNKKALQVIESVQYKNWSGENVSSIITAVCDATELIEYAEHLQKTIKNLTETDDDPHGRLEKWYHDFCMYNGARNAVTGNLAYQRHLYAYGYNKFLEWLIEGRLLAYLNQAKQRKGGETRQGSIKQV